MDNDQLQRCQHLISERMGFKLREQDAALLSKTLHQRIQAHRLASADSYYDLLRSSGPAADKEWRQLFVLLTNQESYFFRDQGQFDLLREIIVPRLIEENQQQRTLRIWSAGCSTGEEPYSLAILIDQLLPLRHNWQIHVLGTDLSDAALEKARRGMYGSWSFRMMPKETAERYFIPRQERFELLPRIREMVTFRHGNLLEDQYPNTASGTSDLDLILCRNVFIYFKRQVVASVISKFNRCIRENGYLLTGHAELHDTPLGLLKPCSFPRSVIYQRVRETPSTTAPLWAPPNATVPRALSPTHKPVVSTPAPAVVKMPASKPPGSPAVGSSVPVEEALSRLQRGDSAGTLQLLAPWLIPEQRSYPALCLGAQAAANLGRYAEALDFCDRAEKINRFAALPFHVRARISEEQSDLENAKALLKKVIYLEPRWVTPYLELSNLYELEGEIARAAKMRQTALEIVSKMADTDIAPADSLSGEERPKVGELRIYLRNRS